jgi:hypothetical protein
MFFQVKRIKQSSRNLTKKVQDMQSRFGLKWNEQDKENHKQTRNWKWLLFI